MGLLKAASVLLLALASTTSAFPTFPSSWLAPSSTKDVYYTNRVVESLAAPPRGWAKDDVQSVDKDTGAIRLRVHLVHQDMAKFYELALNIATPGHSAYGSHMPQKSIDAIIAPKEESGAMVMEWLAGHGLQNHAKYSKRGDAIIIEASISQIEELLDAEYSVYCECEFLRWLVMSV